jgi:hypothetical protein
MLRLILATFPIEEMKKNSSNHEIENRAKNTSKNHEKEKHGSRR